MYIIQYSCYGTLAKKFNSTIFKIMRKYGKPPTFEITVVEKKKNLTLKRTKKISVLSTDQVRSMITNRSRLIKEKDPFSVLRTVNWRTYKNLDSSCIICGAQKDVEWHHVNRIKNIKVEGFTKVMQQLNRKVVPLCHQHHLEVEHGKYNGVKLGQLVEIESWLI